METVKQQRKTVSRQAAKTLRRKGATSREAAKALRPKEEKDKLTPSREDAKEKEEFSALAPLRESRYI